MLSEPATSFAAPPAAATALDIAIGLTTALVAATLWVAVFTVREALGLRRRRPPALADARPVSAA